MEKNPFNELISQIKDISRNNLTENKIFNIGIVISPLPDLIVKTSGIELDKENLYVDKWLLDRHKESETYTSGIHTHDGECDGQGEHMHMSEDYVDQLKAGDRVVMLRDDDMFYILSKVVKIDE